MKPDIRARSLGDGIAVRAIVFDFDGVIVDTETSLLQSWMDLFAHHGCPPPSLVEWKRRIGSSLNRDLMPNLLKYCPEIDEHEARRWRVQRSRELCAQENVMPGVTNWLRDAGEQGVLLGVASSSPSEWVLGNLRRLSVSDSFTAISCAGPRIPGKPAPDLYLRTCAALGVPPEAALAVEDSPNGIRAAKLAGLLCIAVPNKLTSDMDLSQADLVIPSLADCTFEEAVGRLAADQRLRAQGRT
ncbi:HAD-IA family hydrolase [Streptomyces sp. S.PNR 29]|uniref:HAD family hydrolase n=1 Tax=Streptomyces sp. S.PNR 29 TaxID=2973805 RepID=UPI0025B2120D|nr:HAD-IA family hydrolase [Streptomyces sp. S.PNR 29]MDN0194363.1 HAD-IA family hydrolase [Streptomyces sp. S.PNR 29]